MNKENIIEIIELASIIIAGSLGLAGTLTKTRDKKGNLTKWGIITVIGIILSNSFSFTQRYLKQQKEKTDQIIALKKENDKQVAENANHKQTIELLSNNLHKSEASLSKQLIIQKQSSELQKQSGKLLSQVNQSIAIQNKTFKQSQVLNAQQHEATDDIERTLNPLLPFKIDLEFALTPAPNTLLSAFTVAFNKDIDNSKSTSPHLDTFTKFNNDTGTFYLVHANYNRYDYYIERINFLKIVLTFSRYYKDGSLKTITGEVSQDYFKNQSNLKDFMLIYNKTKNYYYFVLENLPVKVTEYAGLGFNSTKDLQDATLQFQILQSPGSIITQSLKFKFPPEFSKIAKLIITTKGSNVQKDLYFNYSLTNPCKLKDK